MRKLVKERVDHNEAKFGVFVYLRDNDENIDNEYWYNEEEALDDAKEKEKIFDKSEYYIEVWPRPENGYWGSTGAPIWSSDEIVENPVFETAEPKDIDRIKGLFKRSKGDDEKLVQFTQNMANSITDYNKAIRRAEAAENVIGSDDNPIANIFRERAEEIDKGVDVQRERRSTSTSRSIELPENPKFNSDDLPTLPWSKNKKFAGILYLPTYSAIAIWNWEITGQLSDGAWENSKPDNHWRFWADLFTKLGRPEVQSNKNPMKIGYNLSGLIQYVGDRMVDYGRFGKAVEENIEKLGSEVRSTVEEFPEEGPFNLREFKENMIKNKSWRKDSYYWKGLTQKMVDAYYDVSYTEKDLRKDLSEIKKAMKSIRSDGSSGYGWSPRRY